jgi:formylglycine-generating enzyme required for sulfatase activity
VLDAGKQASEWSCGPGEFVVREIEVKEKKVVRLAIDFIADTEYGRPAMAKRDARRIVRGSLRLNSLLQPSVPNLDADAADYTLTDPAPAGLRGMKFVPLPKGTFYMGWDGTKGSAKKTEIKEDFEIAIYTVTQGQWQELMWNNSSRFSRQGGGKEAVKDIKDEDLKKFPVERLSWNDVQEFIKKLNEREKGKGYVYRLPTEAEWEYACRGGATTEEECSYHFYFEKPTNDLSSKQANFDGRKPFGKGEEGPHLDRTAQVGSYAPNKLGLYDMHGNVWQWTDSLSREGAGRVLRGGSWRSPASSCRVACRPTYAPHWHDDTRLESVGFRLARVAGR